MKWGLEVGEILEIFRKAQVEIGKVREKASQTREVIELLLEQEYGKGVASFHWQPCYDYITLHFNQGKEENQWLVPVELLESPSELILYLKTIHRSTKSSSL